MGADLFHTDGRIDMTKLLFAFRNFVNARKILRSAHTVYLCLLYEGWKFNSGNYLFTTDTK